MRRKAVPKVGTQRQYEAGDGIYLDYSGPITPMTPQKETGFIVYVVYGILYTFVELVKNKNDNLEKIKKIVTFIETQLGKKLKIAHSDGGGEIEGCAAYFTEKGIRWESTVAHCPWQNGKAERRIQHIWQLARTQIISSGLPGTYWGYAVKYAVDIINRTLIYSAGVTPYEEFFNEPPPDGQRRTMLLSWVSPGHRPKPRRLCPFT